VGRILNLTAKELG